MSEATKRPDRSKKERQPLGQRARLTFRGDMEEGYNYRVINDKDDRLTMALEGGYEFVESKEKLGDNSAAEATAIGKRVSKPVGGGTQGFLMRIPNEFFLADKAAKEASIKETEANMHPNKTNVEDAYGKGITNE